MACRIMGGSLIKKGVVGAALATGAMYLVFGTHAPSYLKTALHRARANAQGAVPVQFEIDRARQEIANLEPAIKEGIAQYVKAERDFKDLDSEITTTRANLDGEKTAMRELRGKLETGDLRLAGTVSWTPEEVRTELGRRLDSYKTSTRRLESKEATLKAKQKTLAALRDHLNQMRTAKKDLQAKIDNIEASVRMIETTSEGRDFHFDDSALARAKGTIAGLERRVQDLARQAELEGKYAETGVPIAVESNRDVVKEIDRELGPPAPKAAEGDKSL